MQVIKEFKGILAKNRIRYTAEPDDEYVAHPDRDYRMVSGIKWKEMLGVARFDRYPTYVPDKLVAKYVEVRMSQHIGAPSTPCVAVGDMVVENQQVSTPGEGLSVPHFAPITGRIAYVDAQKIVIQAK